MHEGGGRWVGSNKVVELKKKNTGMDSHSLLQGIFLTQVLNLGLPHCRQILYYLSHWGGLGSSFIILERTWYRFVWGTKSVTLTPIQKTMANWKKCWQPIYRRPRFPDNNFYKSTRKSKQSRKVSKVCDHDFQKRKYKRLLKDMLRCSLRLLGYVMCRVGEFG